VVETGSWLHEGGVGEWGTGTEMVVILVEVLVSQMRSCLKTYQIAHFKCVQFIVYQTYCLKIHILCPNPELLPEPETGAWNLYLANVLGDSDAQ
jgi:hypothetical protein